MKNIKERKKGFTLVEILIVVSVMGIISSAMTWTSARAAASAKATSIVRSLVNCKKDIMARYTDNLDELYYNNLHYGTKRVRNNNADEGYLTETFSNVTEEDGKKVTMLFIEYDSPDKKFDKKISRSLVQYAKTLRLYKSPDNLSENNLIAGEEIKTPFYMFVKKVAVK